MRPGGPDGPVTVWLARGALGEGLLRRVLAAELDQEPSAVDIGRECGACGGVGHGKPYSVAWPSLGLNASRAGALLCGVAIGGTRPLGLDLEDVRRVPEGAASVVGLADSAPRAAVARQWVRIEAALKASATGLVVATKEVGVPEGVALVDLDRPDHFVGAGVAGGVHRQPRLRGA